MNEVFLIGKIISYVNFEFMINSKHISIAFFKMATLDGQIIDIKVYDKLADFIYSRLKIGDLIFVYGKLREDYLTGERIIIL